MRLHHVFDWSGFTFAIKSIGILLLAGTVGYLALSYASASNSPAPSLVLIQETKPAQGKLSLSLSTTTSEHIIDTLSISDAVPPSGKFIAIDLSTMVLTLYQDGAAIAKHPILTTAAVGSPEQTPAGFYTVLAKESDHFDLSSQLDLPWSVQFYGNYFIHGWPYAANGSPIDASVQGGGIRLSSEDAQAVYAFADLDTGIFVYNPLEKRTLSSLALDTLPLPPISATSYLVADIDTGDVLLSKHVSGVFPLGSLTTLMTALVANETITADTRVVLPRDPILATKTKEIFLAGDLLYPILMHVDLLATESLTEAYGTERFVSWMNSAAKALDMPSTRFADATGSSTANVSTPDDLFRLAAYLADKKPFILDAAVLFEKDLIARSGKVYHLGRSASARSASVSVSTLPLDPTTRRVAVIVLGSADAATDALALTDWVTLAARQGASLGGTACITCAFTTSYRKIQR